jgi:cellulose 1,4-beta-cellobiosidase
MDANWRWTHGTGGYQNCYTGTSWDTSFCPDPVTCAKNCAIDGVDTNDMINTYGVSSTGNALRLNFVTNGQYSKNVGSRMYMLQDDSNYQIFKLKGKEFTFTVDDSKLDCGINGALYFVNMDQDGGLSKYSGNQAGAKYGTGYCDAQCPHDIKFINGEANILDWNTSTAMGKYGTCCAEMDIWEANNYSSAYTAHPCKVNQQTRCEDPVTCGDDTNRFAPGSTCDKDGCDLNPFRANVKDFFGMGKTVDTTKPITVVTQFITDDGTENGNLVEIKRKFVQNGKVFEHPQDALGGSKTYNSLSDDMCAAHKQVFGDTNDFKNKGGMSAMSGQLDKGMVLVMSLWDDHAADMLWLDSTYPKTKTSLGGPRGSCATSSGDPDSTESKDASAYVEYSNVRFGEIDSTYQDMLYKPDVDEKTMFLA